MIEEKRKIKKFIIMLFRKNVCLSFCISMWMSVRFSENKSENNDALTSESLIQDKSQMLL